MSVCSHGCVSERRCHALTSDSWPGSWAESLNSIVRAVICFHQNSKMSPAMDKKTLKSTAWAAGAQVADRHPMSQTGAGDKGISSAGAELELVSVLLSNNSSEVLLPAVVVPR